jgi:hypothetical protein
VPVLLLLQTLLHLRYLFEHWHIIVSSVNGYQLTGFDVSECYVGLLFMIVSGVGIV